MTAHGDTPHSMYCRRDTRRKLVYALVLAAVGVCVVSLLSRLMKGRHILGRQNSADDSRGQHTFAENSAMLTHYRLGADTVVTFAVYERRSTRRIIFFAAQPSTSRSLECRFEASEGSPVTKAKRTLVSQSDTFDSHYNVLNFYSFECPLPDQLPGSPRKVVIQQQGQVDSVHVPVSWYPKAMNPTPPIKLAVCVKTSRGDLDAVRLVEWFEMNRLIGINDFIMYDGGVTGKARRVLDYYASKGTLTIIKDLFFPYVVKNAERLIPDAFKTRRKEKLKLQLLQAELASINDCMYRFKSKYNYILVIDVDEVLIPSNYEPITELVDRLRQWRTDASAYAFLSSHHFKDFGSTDAEHKIPTYLHMMRHLRRTNPDWFQAKSIFVPGNVYTAGWHKPQSTTLGTLSVHKVEERAGYIHHYRDHCKDKFSKKSCKDVLKSWTTDSIVPRYHDRASFNVVDVLKLLNLLQSIGNGSFPSYRLSAGT